MDIRNCFPSKYLEAKDVPQDVVLTMQRIEMGEVGQAKTPKPILFFEGVQKGMVLNKTNANTIGAMYGFETGNWVGQPITVYSADVEFQGEMKPSLRVRTTPPMPAQQSPPLQQPATIPVQPAASQEPAAPAATAPPSQAPPPSQDIGAILRAQGNT